SVNEDFLFLNTGSPHHILFSEEIELKDIKKEGAEIRYSERYGNAGTNVNFVEGVSADTFSVRTYERGVEDETLSCGTGVTAVALAAYESGKTNSEKVNLKTPGGELSVTFKKTSNGYSDIWLSGPATKVFKGEITC
ncbi:MAG TPA: diaminopimelate epimerase, partial [Christiangramia sp.]|nr:diaminopimelate epimerase [Christiangramia sp.]